MDNGQWVADLLLAGGELGDVGVVALLHVLVGALQDGLLLQAGHRLLLLHAAQPGLGVLLAAAEVDAALDGNLFILSASPSGLQVMICSLMFSVSENSFTGHPVTVSTYHLHLLGIYIYRASTISTQYLFSIYTVSIWYIQYLHSLQSALTWWLWPLRL